MNYEGITSALIELRELKKELTKLVWEMEDVLEERSPRHTIPKEYLAEAYRKLWSDLHTLTYKIQSLTNGDE